MSTRRIPLWTILSAQGIFDAPRTVQGSSVVIKVTSLKSRPLSFFSRIVNSAWSPGSYSPLYAVSIIWFASIATAATFGEILQLLIGTSLADRSQYSYPCEEHRLGYSWCAPFVLGDVEDTYR